MATFEHLYEELECKKSNRKLYKLAKAREKRAQVLDQVKSIKNENDKVLVEEMHIRLRWKTYLHKLLNEEGQRDIMLGELEPFQSQRDFSYCRCINTAKVEGATRKIQRGRQLIQMRPSKFLEEYRQGKY